MALRGPTVALTAALLATAGLAPARLMAEPLRFQSIRYNAGPGETHRVQADLPRTIASWSGTTDCAAPRRGHAALKPGLAHWLGSQMVARPGRNLAQWGYHSGDIWVESRKVDGKPRCTAGFRKLIAYADFR